MSASATVREPALSGQRRNIPEGFKDGTEAHEGRQSAPELGPKIRSTTARSKKRERPMVNSNAMPRTFHQGRPSSTS